MAKIKANPNLSNKSSEPIDLVMGQGMSEALFNVPKIEQNEPVLVNTSMQSFKPVSVEQKKYEDMGFRFEEESEREYVYNRPIKDLDTSDSLLNETYDEDDSEYLTKYMRKYDDFNLAAETTRGKLGAALAITQGIDPEKEARLNRLGELLRLPRETIENSPEIVKEVAEYRDDFEYLQSIVSPEALNWFANPGNFSQAKGDLALKKLDSIYTSNKSNIFSRLWYDLGEGWTGMKRAALGSKLGIIEGGSDIFKKVLGGFHEFMLERRINEPNNDLSYLQNAIDSKSPEEWKEFARQKIAETDVPQAMKDLVESKSAEELVQEAKQAIKNNDIPEEQKQYISEIKTEVENRVRSELSPTIVETNEEKKERLLKEFYNKEISTNLRKDLGKAENTQIPLLDPSWLDQVASMTPLMAMGIAIGTVTNGVGAAFLFGQQAQGGSYLELTDSNVSPAISLLGSTTIGTGEGMLEYLTFQSFGRIAKSFGLVGTNKIGWLDAMLNVGKEQSKEYLQEYAQSISSEGQLAAYKYLFADGYDLHNAVEDFADKGLVGGSQEALLVLPFGLLGGGAYLANYAGRAKAANQAFDYYLEHMDAASKSKLRENNPKKFSDFLRTVMSGAFKRNKTEARKESNKSEIVSEDNTEKIKNDLKSEISEQENIESESYNQSFYLKADKAKEILDEYYRDPEKMYEFLDKVGVDKDCFEVCAKSKAYVSVDAVNWGTYAAKTHEEELLRNHIRVNQNVASMDEIFVEGKEAEELRDKIEIASERLRNIKDDYEKIIRNHRSAWVRSGINAKTADNLMVVSRKMFSTLAQEGGEDISNVASRVSYDTKGNAYYRPKINVNKIRSEIQNNKLDENSKLEKSSNSTAKKVLSSSSTDFSNVEEAVANELIGRSDGLGKNTFNVLSKFSNKEKHDAFAVENFIVNNINELIEGLIADRVIDQDEVSVLLNEDNQTVNMHLVQDLLIGNIIPRAMPGGMAGYLKDKLSIIAPYIMASNQNAEWDLRPLLFEAVKYIGGKHHLQMIII